MHGDSSIDVQREEVQAELRATGDATARERRMQAYPNPLLSTEWHEDPNVVRPYEYLTAASQEEIRRACRRYGARFGVNQEGVLRLRLEMGLDEGASQLGTSS